MQKTSNAAAKQQKQPLTAYEKQKQRELEAAKGLVKLSGQSLTETRAALTLVKLKEESKVIMRNEYQRQQEILSQAKKAIDAQNAEAKRAMDAQKEAKRVMDAQNVADRFLGFREFRAWNPEELCASWGMGGGDVAEVVKGKTD